MEQEDLINVVQGRETADLTGKEVFENALFNHNTKGQIHHPEAPRWGEGEVALGLDLKLTTEGNWKVIELMSQHFGTNGYSTSYHWGDVSLGKPTLGYNDLADTLNFVDNKRTVSENLPSGRQINPVENYLESTSDQIIYVKNPGRDGGTGVEVMREQDLTADNIAQILEDTRSNDKDELIVEERVHSETENVRGRQHDRCMRYAVVMDSNPQGMDLKFKGGYWKIAPEPIGNENSDLNERYIANFKDGFSRPASFRELREATEYSMKVAEEVFSAAIQSRLDGEITPECWKRYGQDMEHEWEEDFMQWTAYETQ